jgi:O-antigen ligase
VLIVLFIFIPNGGKDIQGALTDRFSADDAAGTSRAQLVGPLLSAIKQHPLLGQGFGATVTYHSNDPRIKNPTNPQGIVTTSAFEWGYLDQWLKWGLFGMLLWAWVIFRQYARGMRIFRRDTDDAVWVASLLAGLVFILFVHVVSPYLNLP